MRDPNRPYWPCLFCFERNRAETCDFVLEGLQQSYQIGENVPLLEPRTASHSLQTDYPGIQWVEGGDGPFDFQNLHLPVPLGFGGYIDAPCLQSLTRFLNDYFTIGPRVTNLQITVVPTDQGHVPSCLIVKWKESHHVEILVIKIQPMAILHGYALYRVQDVGEESTGRKTWRVSCTVLNVIEMRELISAGRKHIERTVKKAIQGFESSSGWDVDEAEMMRHAVTWMPILYDLRQMEKNFNENGVFWVEKLCPRTVLEDGNGNLCTLLQPVMEF
jgi:hypothetical protein